MIDTSDLAIFLAAALTLNLTPGNDMTFVIGQSMRGGFRTGAMASLGISTGSAVHLLLVALGVAVILDRYPLFFDAIRYAGATYLIWLAWQSLRTNPPEEEAREASSSTAFAAWRDGLLVNLLNPKVIVFMFAFLPPFIRPENGAPLLQLFILGTIFNAGGTAINLIVAGAAGRLAGKVSQNRVAIRWLGRFSALILAGLAARLILERR
jgi:threonine/homoserine/homoserine lactone efflux protein